MADERARAHLQHQRALVLTCFCILLIIVVFVGVHMCVCVICHKQQYYLGKALLLILIMSMSRKLLQINIGLLAILLTLILTRLKSILLSVYILGRFRRDIRILRNFFPPEILHQMLFSQSYFPQDEHRRNTIPTNSTLILKNSPQNYLVVTLCKLRCDLCMHIAHFLAPCILIYAGNK